MITAYGTITELVRDGVTVWDATFCPSYRHTIRIFYGPIDHRYWPSEEAATKALKHEAGGPIEITTYYSSDASVAAAMKRKAK